MNYGQLKAAIATRLARGDMAALIPDFITFGLPRIYYGFKDAEIQTKPLRHRSMLKTETASLTLPDDYLAINSLSVPMPVGVRNLTYKTPEEFAAIQAATLYSSGVYYPTHYTINSGAIEVQGGTPASFTLSYYAKYPDLTLDADTNWLLANAPNVAFYSALIEAYQHIKDDARGAVAARQYAGAVSALIDYSSDEAHSGSTLSMQARAPV